MTKEERRLWYDFLKALPVTVNRQKVIGKYIASAKLAIELDGSQHYEEEHAQQDRERDAAPERLGIRTLRYANSDVNTNFRGVCKDVLRALGQ